MTDTQTQAPAQADENPLFLRIRQEIGSTPVVLVMSARHALLWTSACDSLGSNVHSAALLLTAHVRGLHACTVHSGSAAAYCGHAPLECMWHLNSARLIRADRQHGRPGRSCGRHCLCGRGPKHDPGQQQCCRWAPMRPPCKPSAPASMLLCRSASETQ